MCGGFGLCVALCGCAGQDLNLRSLTAMDLQSIAFDHSATDALREYNMKRDVFVLYFGYFLLHCLYDVYADHWS